MHRTEGLYNRENKYYDGPPGTIIEPEHLNAIQEEICSVIEGAGIQVSSKSSDTVPNQLLQALNSFFFLKPYSVIINSQFQFNSLIERVAANHYKIKDGYYSVYLKYMGVRYACAGSSFLTSGDTWGYIDTNQCTCLEAEGGAYLDFDTSAGYLNVNTDHCQLKNIVVYGASGAASQSFQLTANYVEFINCKTTNRTSSASFAGFRGSATALHNSTSKYVGCSSYSLTGSANVFGFHTCSNLTDCVVYSLTAPAAGTIDGFYACTGLSSCHVNTLSGTAGVYGFNTCYQAAGCQAYYLTTSSAAGYVIGFNACYNISGSTADTISNSSTGNAVGFSGCYNLSGCYAYNISNNSVAAYAMGFSGCYNLSGCSANKIDNVAAFWALGFSSCNQLSGCYANDVDAVGAGAGAIAYGFFNCLRISSCFATDIDSGAGGAANGFNTCTYGSSLYSDEAANAGNDYIDAADATLAHQFSSLGV